MTHSERYIQAVTRPEKISEVSTVAKRMIQNKPRYEAVSLTLATGMPWWFVAIVHFMEGGGKFTRHLHNGDPLTARTVNVPKGRPVMGKAPFSWEESAIDAINYMENRNKFWKASKGKWDLENCLLKFEAYNGMGYRTKGINSPYLYSYTQFYTVGKYASDNKFDPKLVSKQPGVIPLMKALGV
jgi:lysozyme family protein